MNKIFILFLCAAFSVFSSDKKQGQNEKIAKNDSLKYPEEHHFKNLRQLTFGGDNAEAYFSFDGKYIVFQRTDPKNGILCDQI